MSMKLYVDHFAFQTMSEDLHQGRINQLMSLKIETTDRAHGFGFVEISSKEEGEACVTEFNSKEVKSRNLTVNEAG